VVAKARGELQRSLGNLAPESIFCSRVKPARLTRNCGLCFFRITGFMFQSLAEGRGHSVGSLGNLSHWTPRLKKETDPVCETLCFTATQNYGRWTESTTVRTRQHLFALLCSRAFCVVRQAVTCSDTLDLRGISALQEYSRTLNAETRYCTSSEGEPCGPASTNVNAFLL
jgi:hypothetical protein